MALHGGRSRPVGPLLVLCCLRALPLGVGALGPGGRVEASAEGRIVPTRHCSGLALFLCPWGWGSPEPCLRCPGRARRAALTDQPAASPLGLLTYCLRWIQARPHWFGTALCALHVQPGCMDRIWSLPHQVHEAVLLGNMSKMCPQSVRHAWNKTSNCAISCFRRPLSDAPSRLTSLGGNVALCLVEAQFRVLGSGNSTMRLVRGLLLVNCGAWLALRLEASHS